MKIRISAAAPLMLLIACNPAQDAAPEPEPSANDANANRAPDGAADTQQAVATLSGEWRVAGIDGGELDEPYGIALSADEQEIWWEPRCAFTIHTYRIDGQTIAVTESAPVADTAAAPTDCSTDIPPRLHDVARALLAAKTVERTPQNGVLLSGGGHSLLLFSQ